MSLILPEWVKHHLDNDDKKKRQTIFSVSVHPDGSRLATGGLDQKIRIWATEPILDEEVEKMQGSSKVLCTMARHTGSVLVVRWSASGRFLASGSDDAICLIWDLDPTGMGGASFGSLGGEVNVEAWRPHKRLAGHQSDIVDLAWSPDTDDSYIATVGLDSRVIVWSGPREGGGAFEQIKVINGHEGFVKGVVWDPIGEYLATASDDKTFKFWRTGGDWGLVKSVTKPFDNSPSSTFFRRPSWSPEGAHILSANAMSGPVFVASVIKRDDWSTDIHLVGHENSVAVTAFSPKLFYDSKDKDTPVSVMALGSLDQSVSIWVTGQPRPILVARDVFQRQVMDLSWSSDGLTLYACSADGNIAAFTFTPDELRFPVPDNVLLSSRETFNYTEKQKIFKHGRHLRHINGFGAPSQGTLNRPNMLTVRKAGVPRAPTSGGAPPLAKARSTRLDQQITVTSDGKRRIRPTLMDGGSSDASHSYESVTPSVQSVHSVDSAFKAPELPASASAFFDEQRSTVNGEVEVAGTKRRASSSFQDGPETTLSTPAGKRIKDVGRTLGGDLQRERAGPSVALRTSNANGVPTEASLATFASARLPMPPILSIYKCDDANTSIEVRNFDSARPSEIYLVEQSTGKAIWMDFSSSGAHLATLSDSFAAVAFENGSLGVYSAKGRRVSTLQLDTPCCRLESYSHHLVAITTDGTLRRWNMRSDTEAGRPISIMSLFSRDVGLLEQDEIVHFWVHTNGLPVIMMRSERAYTLDPAKNAWVLVCSGWFADCSPIWEGRTRGRGASMDSISGGGLAQTRRDPIRAIESEINDLVVIQRQVTGIAPAGRPPADRTSEFNVTIMLKHLELRVTAAALLDSATEYKTHLMSYARKLSEEGIRNQAEDLCRSLLGPIYYNPTLSESQGSQWNPMVCGLSKRALLHDVLRIMSKGTLLLGLHSTYQELLRNVNCDSW